jgi:hypothetical protein
MILGVTYMDVTKTENNKNKTVAYWKIYGNLNLLPLE